MAGKHSKTVLTPPTTSDYHNFTPTFLYLSDTKVLLLGCIQSLFEGSMYVFVFMWTPALTEPHGDESSKVHDDESAFPYGLIFACFMV